MIWLIEMEQKEAHGELMDDNIWEKRNRWIREKTGRHWDSRKWKRAVKRIMGRAHYDLAHNRIPSTGLGKDTRTEWTHAVLTITINFKWYAHRQRRNELNSSALIKHAVVLHLGSITSCIILWQLPLLWNFKSYRDGTWIWQQRLVTFPSNPILTLSSHDSLHNLSQKKFLAQPSKLKCNFLDRSLLE